MGNFNEKKIDISIYQFRMKNGLGIQTSDRK